VVVETYGEVWYLYLYANPDHLKFDLFNINHMCM